MLEHRGFNQSTDTLVPLHSLPNLRLRASALARSVPTTLGSALLVRLRRLGDAGGTQG